jgi:uncharacterized protein
MENLVPVSEIKTLAKKKAAAPKPKYDCSQCPGYCCSYDRIEVTTADIKRLAKHFSLSYDEAELKFTRLWEPGERILRHQKDEVYVTICQFFHLEERRCTIYKARPGVCRDYPDGKKCGYYDFLKFERKHQGDDTFIPSA